jgi:DNA polymerase I-like protein with 3'-5' exonuclease and polymerase domains
LLKIRKQYKVVHTVHDELVVIVDENQAEECLQFMLTTMRSSPAWWPEIRLWAEGDIADSYGQAK